MASVSGPDAQAFWEAMQQAFAAAHPKLTVTIESYSLAAGQSRDDVLFANLAAGTVADAWVHDVTRSYQQPLVDKGALLPLDGYYRTMPSLKQIFAWARDRARLQGKIYGVPMAAEFIAVYYNKGVFDRAGIKELPKTFNDFLEVNNNIKKTGIIPMAVQKERTNPGHNYSTYLMGLIGRAGYEELFLDGKRAWDKEPGVRQAAETLVNMQKRGYMLLDVLTNESADVKVDFPNGNTGIWITGMWNESTFQKSRQANPGFDYDFFILPSQNPAVPPTVAGGLGDGAEVWAQTKNRDGIVEWLDWSIGPDGQRLRVEMAKTVPTLPYNPDAFKVDDQFRRVLRLYSNAKDFGYNLSETLPADVAQVYWNGIMAMLNQQLTPDQWVGQMQAQWDVAKSQGKTPQR
jgi:ABC-type glycerol-3-phosphate transport system substrate-binding protein